MERRNAEFIMRGSNAQEREIITTAKNLSEWFLRRGMRLAPMIESRIDNREYVDKELREALRKSQDMNALLKASPSFSAWF